MSSPAADRPVRASASLDQLTGDTADAVQDLLPALAIQPGSASSPRLHAPRASTNDLRPSSSGSIAATGALALGDPADSPSGGPRRARGSLPYSARSRPGR